MKAGFIGAAALGLASFAMAQPHGVRHVHKRDVVYDYVTVEQEEIVVYVDQNDKPVATSTFWSDLRPTASVEASTAIPTSAVVPTSAAAAPAPKPEAPQSAAAPAPAAPAPSSPAPAPASTPAASGSSSGSGSSGSGSSGSGSSGSSSGAPAASKAGQGFGYGVSYSPYTASNGCKSLEETKSEIAKLPGGYQVIRIYGTDCNQVGNLIQATAGKNVQIFAGVFDLNSWQSEVQIIIDAVKNNAGGNWGVIHTVNIGNELVNDGSASVSQVTSAVSSARSVLRAAGFQGSVVTVDTMVAYKNNPTLASTSDYVAMNCHAFFDGNTVAQNAGEFVQGWISQIKAIAGSKEVVVTESGWPWQGSANGKAVPSTANQQAAISSLRGHLSNNLILYSAFDQAWMKDTASTYGTEKYWGMYDH